jgi:hypothetical protein
MADWKPLLDLLQKNEAALSFGTGDERSAYVAEMTKEIEKAQLRENDNKRAATLIAVDAAKTFVQIAIALIVAIVGFIQFSYRNVAGWLLLWLALAAFLAFVSMCAGFIVISRAYKKGDGRITSTDAPWSTTFLRIPINVQAIAGVIALITFASALAIFNTNVGRPKQFVITMPDGSTSVRSAIMPIVITGTWSTLSVEQRGVYHISVPPAPSAKPKALRIELR